MKHIIYAGLWIMLLRTIINRYSVILLLIYKFMGWNLISIFNLYLIVFEIKRAFSSLWEVRNFLSDAYPLLSFAQHFEMFWKPGKTSLQYWCLTFLASTAICENGEADTDCKCMFTEVCAFGCGICVHFWYRMLIQHMDDTLYIFS